MPVDEPVAAPRDEVDPTHALGELRGLLRTRRRGNLDRGDLFYRFYVTGLVAMFASYIALGAIDNAPIGPQQIAWVGEHGAAWVGLIGSVLLAAGLRSGATGGPLSIDTAELHHLVMSPLPRTVVLRSSTLRLIVGAVALGGVVGIAAGELASRRLPGSQAAWLATGMLLGITLGAGTIGGALTAASLRVLRERPGIASALAMGLVVWAALDISQGWRSAPTTSLGVLALWPMTFVWWPIVAPLIALALVAFGRIAIAGLSIERAARRSALIRQVRFALAQQDIRSLILLRRQLGFERPRRRPLVRIAPGRFEHRAPAAYRAVRSYLRWPTQRLIRVGALALVGGLALAGVWRGTTALAVAFAAVSYLVSLEVVEPFSQELDHGALLGAAPVTGPAVLLVHLAMATGLMAVLWAGSAAVAVAVTGSSTVLEIMAISALPVAAAAVGGAAISTRRVGNSGSDTALFMPDEMAGSAMVIRLVWPIALAGLGAFPVVLGRSAVDRGDQPLPVAIFATVAIGVVAVAMLSWIRLRDEFSKAMVSASESR